MALVTGAASGIGKACVASLLQRGAAVVGLDVDMRIEILTNLMDEATIAAMEELAFRYSSW